MYHLWRGGRSRNASQMDVVTVLNQMSGRIFLPYRPYEIALNLIRHRCYLAESHQIGNTALKALAISQAKRALWAVYSGGGPEDM